MNTTEPTPSPSLHSQRDNYRDPTSYEAAILRGMGRKHIYTGTRAWRRLSPRAGIGIGDIGKLPERWEPDQATTGPLQADVDRRHARNRAARKSRRINRARGVAA